ncbi:MAG: 23S rRNA (guanosine(2251)-2'-O)-methyltransferase RlmB [Cyanobacteria bacterium SIG28]|nr:23S rRNA (guanosine(2251)-2'-O)-methyltransferase RlmB [Cyanobacteria bacterium SIG28]
MTETNNFIYGKNAVIEALESSEREFNRILISNSSRSDEKIEKIKDLAKRNGVIFQFVGKEKLNQIAQENRHQGVIAQVAPIKYIDLDEFIEKHSNELTSVVILDGVEDSHNLGAIIRSAVCAGVKGIILPSRRGVLVNSTVEKTSAGAVNHISIIKVNSIVNAVQRLKEKNYWVIASDHHAEDNYYDIDYTDMNFALIMGAEHAGISKSLLNLSDFKVKIPMLTNFNSLNVSNATAIILFESVRQKMRIKKK